jgi:ornithine cyclodeaminase/alanine dehydrogenase-like protein (mu-crystallin family)
MLLLSRAEVEELLDLDALIDALAEAMADLSAGRASVPHPVAALVPDQEGLLAAMPGYTPPRERWRASSSRSSPLTPTRRCPPTKP